MQDKDSNRWRQNIERNRKAEKEKETESLSLPLSTAENSLSATYNLDRLGEQK